MPRRRFLRYLHAEPPLEQMLFFHGDGGNGKSLLLKLLLTGYCRRLPAADWARLDAIEDDRACVGGYDALIQAADAAVTVPCVYHDLAGLGSADDDPQGYWSGPLMIGRALGARGFKLPLFDFGLIGHLDPPDADEYLIRALGHQPGRERALYFELGDRLRFHSSAADFGILTRFSFVWRDPVRSETGPDRYRIHDLLRRLIAGLEPEPTREAHAALEAIYRGRGADDPEAVAEAIYQANRQDWERGWEEWLKVMDDALANARYALGDALAALRTELQMETAYATGTVARRIGELAAARARHGAAEAAFREALASLDEALGQAPDNVAAYNEKGIVLSMLGELRAALSDHAGAEGAYTEAIGAYGEALARAPDYVAAHINKGNALSSFADLHLTLADPARAEAVLLDAIAATNEALRRAPNHVIALGNQGGLLRKLADVQHQRGDTTAACDRLREARPCWTARWPWRRITGRSPPSPPGSRTGCAPTARRPDPGPPEDSNHARPHPIPARRDHQ